MTWTVGFGKVGGWQLGLCATGPLWAGILESDDELGMILILVISIVVAFRSKVLQAFGDGGWRLGMVPSSNVVYSFRDCSPGRPTSITPQIVLETRSAEI